MLRFILILILVVLANVPVVQAERAPEVDDEGGTYVVTPRQYRAVEEGLGWRFGLLGNGLFNSRQGRPFTYLNVGLRYKTDHHYVDLHAPPLFGLVDGLGALLQGGMGVDRPFVLLTALNEDDQLRYIELAILKVGQTLAIHPFADDDGPGTPLRLTVGMMALAEIVFFDAVIRDDFNPNDGGGQFPFIVAPGAFVALGGEAPITRYDLALGAGMDVLNLDGGAPVWVILLDLDVQFAVLPDLAIYLRNRLSTYVTPIDAWIFTMAFSAGVTWRFF
ncbi:MAG: hypothetical protein ACNA8W_09230 [Bradymonadaceae bacterium]